MGQAGGFAIQILLHTNNAALRVCQWSISSHLRVKARHKQPACSDRASETRPTLSLIKLSVISGTDPKARQFSRAVSQLLFQTGLFLPSGSQARESGKSLFPSGLCLPTPVRREERSSRAPVLPPRAVRLEVLLAPSLSSAF